MTGTGNFFWEIMNRKNFVRCDVYVPPQLFEQIRSEAEHFGISVSELFRLLAIERFLQGSAHAVHTRCEHPLTQQKGGDFNTSHGAHTVCTPPENERVKSTSQCEISNKQKRDQKKSKPDPNNQRNWRIQKEKMRKIVEDYIRTEGPIEDYDDDLVNELLKKLMIIPNTRYSYTNTSTPKELLIHEVNHWLFSEES